MKLRTVLLTAFLLLGVLPAGVLAWLGFIKTREAMTSEITHSLSTQAQGIQSDIDAMLFERFENAIVWSRSELMVDLRLGDVDRRVSNYLQGLRDGYAGVYRALDCVDSSGSVVASSDVARIGRPKLDDPGQAPSLDADVTGERARLTLPQAATLDDRLPIVIDTAIPAALAPAGAQSMRLMMDLDAGYLSRMLDDAAGGRRAIVVIDGQGRWVAASRNLRGRKLPDDAGRLAGLRLANSLQTRLAEGSPWLDGAALVGRGHSRASARFRGSGWTTLVFEPADVAFAPVAEMATIFEGLLVAVLFATVLTASGLASAVAHPIAALTASARRYQREGSTTDLERVGSRIEEIDVLGHAYRDMVRSVEESRRELVRSSKMSVLGQLAAVLAHEVRTPLGILRSSAQILKRNSALSPEERELTTFIESETERLNRLVSTMLDMARPRLPNFVECDVHALLGRCAHMHDLRRGVEGEAHPVRLGLAARDPAIAADPEQLMQVVFNLLSNASQAAGPEGRVELETSDTPEAVVIRCCDDGPGIDPELAARLFEPFVSGHEGGIGLGLAVARQIVVAHGGDISAGRSRWGGAAFTLSLPRTHAGLELETTK